jgi:hypothetical protein
MNLARGTIVSVLVCVSATVFGDHVPEFPLEKKVLRSDLVIVGRVVSVAQKAGTVPQYARVSVDTVLKGTPPKSVDVLTKGPITELDPDCCEMGGVFFLLSEKTGKFESVNGRFGIVKIR